MKSQRIGETRDVDAGRPGKPRQPRRRLLRALLAGLPAGAVAATLPDAWRRPVVRAVLLPAHAQTSGGDPPVDPAPGPSGLYLLTGLVTEGSLIGSQGNLFTGGATWTLHITDLGNATAEVFAELDTTFYRDGVLYIEGPQSAGPQVIAVGGGLTPLPLCVAPPAGDSVLLAVRLDSITATTVTGAVSGSFQRAGEDAFEVGEPFSAGTVPGLPVAGC